MNSNQALPLPAFGLPADVRWMNALSSALISLLVIGALAGGLIWLSERPYFALQGVTLRGDVERISAITIRTNVASRLRGNFFGIDLHKAQDAFEAVPWVRKAALRRVWPNRLEVELEEHRPAALWSQDGDADGGSGGRGDVVRDGVRDGVKDGSVDKLVNTFGEIFEANLGDVEDEALPILMGPADSSRSMLKMLQSLSQTLAPLDAVVSKLSLTSRGSWRVLMSNGVTIELGRGSDQEVMQRAAEFVATLPDVISHYGRPLVAADLRHRDGYVLRLQGVSTSLAVDDKTRHR